VIFDVIDLSFIGHGAK